MSEKRTLTIDSVEDKNGFFIVHCGSDKYATKTDKIKNFIGKTAEFNVASKQNGKYTNWYVNDPLPEIPSTGSSNGAPSSDDKNKYFVLSYAKDLTVAMINSAQLKDVSPLNVALATMLIYQEIQDAMNALTEEEIPF